MIHFYDKWLTVTYECGVVNLRTNTLQYPGTVKHMYIFGRLH